jgi:hypothetical protein
MAAQWPGFLQCQTLPGRNNSMLLMLLARRTGEPSGEPSGAFLGVTIPNMWINNIAGKKFAGLFLWLQVIRVTIPTSGLKSWCIPVRHCFRMFRQNVGRKKVKPGVLGIVTLCAIWLVVSNMNFIFQIIYGMSSFPLTNSIIFQDGFLTTNQLWFPTFMKPSDIELESSFGIKEKTIP